MSRDESPTTGGLFGTGSLYAAAFAIQMLVGFAVLPLLTRSLDAASFGTVAAAIIVMQVIAPVAALGLPAAVTRSYFLATGGRSAASSLVVLTAATSLLVVAAFALTGPLWARVFAGLGFGATLAIAIAATVPRSVISGLQGFYSAAGSAWAFVWVTLAGLAAGHVVGLVAVKAGWGANGYLIGMAATAWIAAAVGLLRMRPWGRLSVPVARGAFAFGVPTVAHSLAVAFLQAGDRIVVERSMGLTAVGRYHLAYVLGTLGITFLWALNHAWTPLVYAAAEERRWAILARTAAQVEGLSAGFACALALAAPLLLTIVAPATYDPAPLAAVTSIAAMATLPFAACLARGRVLLQVGRTGGLAACSVLAALANLALNVLLVPRAGLTGAAAATFLSYCVWALALGRVSARSASVAWRTARSVAVWSLSAGVVIGALWLPTGGPWLWARVGAAAAALLLPALGLVRAMVLERGAATFGGAGSRSDVCGVPIVPWTRAEVIDHVSAAVRQGGRTTLVGIYANVVNLAARDPDLRRALNEPGLIAYADGQAVVWAARLLGSRVPERCATTDLFPDIMAMAAREGHRVFYLGAAPGVAERCAAEMRALHPGLRIVGTMDGFFDEASSPDVIAAVNASCADLVMIGLGVPRQERWVDRYRDAIDAPAVLTCGGCFDFHSGNVARAPRWMQRIGMEWLFRMAQEPRRLWRRYIFGNPAFVARVVVSLMGGLVGRRGVRV